VTTLRGGATCGVTCGMSGTLTVFRRLHMGMGVA
jgi:hypothetical protein